ncbi:HDIG domain-containing protein [Paenibacillus sp. J31TS4]|uniref:bis(5'-nucleosyl)-tetraphosphatase (symmetrical) YqeK n=1 Tax=Paenibacillus sp. J31TS4 TaxID=2807195 RepID=UPI001B15BC30|nr:bis(5'-nucleosyl)-tetraphosphatase (symmetrical) YqeK [Paenibacillus sp. J31TS4]GIP38127.1 HDIG domain-containing protein [Paenibacillus sp. J31TS4]
MHKLLLDLAEGVPFSGNLREDVSAFLTVHHCPHTLTHSLRVAAEAKRLAEASGQDPAGAEAAGLLHDISACIPNAGRLQSSQALGVDILPAEVTFPPILHQKLSRVIAQALFGITDEAVLSAIGCHTTLKPGASQFDHILFVADKIEWDQPGTPPYLDRLKQALARSVEHASLVYLEHLWNNRLSLKVLHPWAEEAYRELYSTLDRSATAEADSDRTRLPSAGTPLAQPLGGEA